MKKFADRFDVASPLLPLQSGSKTCLLCGLVITSKETRNNISVRAVEKLKKLDGIEEKWIKVKPVSSHAKNYELVCYKIKDLDTQSEAYEGVMWPTHATCCHNFHNTKKLETNSKQKIHEIETQNSKDTDHIDDDRASSEESVSVLR